MSKVRVVFQVPVCRHSMFSSKQTGLFSWWVGNGLRFKQETKEYRVYSLRSEGGNFEAIWNGRKNWLVSSLQSLQCAHGRNRQPWSVLRAEFLLNVQRAGQAPGSAPEASLDLDEENAEKNGDDESMKGWEGWEMSKEIVVQTVQIATKIWYNQQIFIKYHVLNLIALWSHPSNPSMGSSKAWALLPCATGHLYEDRIRWLQWIIQLGCPLNLFIKNTSCNGVVLEFNSDLQIQR